MKKANCMTEHENIGFTMTRVSSSGQYYIHANYKGMDIRVHTTDSEAWDHLDGDNEEKRQEALQHCYFKIIAEYERIKECF